MKRRVAVFLTFIIVVLVPLSINAQAYTYYDVSRIKNSDSYMSCVDGNGGVYLSGKIDGCFEMYYTYGGNTKSFTFDQMDLKLLAVSGCNGKAAVVSPIETVISNGVVVPELRILMYDFSSDFGDIHGIISTLHNQDCFVLAEDCYYLVQSDRRTLRSYTLEGVLKFSVYAQKPLTQLLYDSRSGKLYAAYEDGTYILSGKSLSDLGEIETPISLSGASSICGSDGRVYNVKGNKLSYAGSSQNGSKAVNINGTLYYAAGSMLYAQNSSGEIVRSIDMGATIEDIYPCGGEIGVMCGNDELSVVATSELSIVNKATQPSVSSNVQSNSVSNSQSDKYNGAGGVGSDVYTVDNNNRTISGISNGTTIAKFKSNLSYGGYKVSFKNSDGKSRTSGNVGTGFTVTFTGSDQWSYTLIVPGDLTGEGNINSLDVRAYMKHLCGKEKVTSPFSSALDINGDGKADTLDLLIASRQ